MRWWVGACSARNAGCPLPSTIRSVSARSCIGWPPGCSGSSAGRPRARSTSLPAFGYVDYRRKVAGLGPSFTPTDDIVADFKVFEAFYAGVTPRYFGQRGVVAVDPAVLTLDSAA